MNIDKIHQRNDSSYGQPKHKHTFQSMEPRTTHLLVSEPFFQRRHNDLLPMLLIVSSEYYKRVEGGPSITSTREYWHLLLPLDQKKRVDEDAQEEACK